MEQKQGSNLLLVAGIWLMVTGGMMGFSISAFASRTTETLMLIKVIGYLMLLAGVVLTVISVGLRVSVPKENSTSEDSSPQKKCPFCAETIQVEAKLCRFCGSNI